MLTFTKKGLIHFALTVALAVSVTHCAWAGLDNNLNKLALKTDGISVYGNDSGGSLYLDEGESYIIDANSPEAASVQSTTRLTGNIQIAGSGKKVSISLRDADVKQVLRMFADKANMNVIFHNSVGGTVTLDLKDVTINSALEFVLEACELTYVRQDNNLIISSKEAAKDLGYTRQNFTIIPVKYVNAQSIANFLNKGIFNGKYQGVSPVPVVTVNAAKNELMVFGTEEDERMVNKILAKLDIKPMMNVFPVNHITPKEMAATICDTILSDKSEGGAQNGVNPSGADSRGGGDDEITLGGGYTVCVVGENNGTIDKGNVDSEDLAQYTSNPMIVAYFPEHGTVALYGGSREQVKMIESFIKLHDKKQPMAYIELALIQLTEEGSKEFQNSWMVWTPFATFQFDPQNGFGTNEMGPIFWRGNGYQVLDDNGEVEKTVYKNKVLGINKVSPIVMTLNYLLTSGKARMLSNPKVMVTNGKKSTIDLSEDYLKSVKTEFAEGYLSPIQSRTYEIASDAGIKVELTPFISPDGYVVMNLNPNYVTVGNTIANGEVTLTSRNNLQLENVRVKDGETLVLAGMISENETQSVTKVPILGDLPAIGPLFRSTASKKHKSEMVIMVTPHIVYSQEHIENLRASQADKL